MDQKNLEFKFLEDLVNYLSKHSSEITFNEITEKLVNSNSISEIHLKSVIKELLENDIIIEISKNTYTLGSNGKKFFRLGLYFNSNKRIQNIEDSKIELVRVNQKLEEALQIHKNTIQKLKLLGFSLIILILFICYSLLS